MNTGGVSASEAQYRRGGERVCSRTVVGRFGSGTDRLSGVGASAGFLSSALGVARCGLNAGCVLCVLWAMSAAVCVGGYPVGVSISSS